MHPRHTIAVVVICTMIGAACGVQEGPGLVGATDVASEASSTAAPDAVGQRYPDIVGVEITKVGAETFDLAVTVSSPYDTPERYADGWRVLAPDGSELGTHTLLHDHAGEQPFTRTQAAVAIPAEVDEVTVEGRDRRHGFGGTTVTVEVPHGQR